MKTVKVRSDVAVLLLVLTRDPLLFSLGCYSRLGDLALGGLLLAFCAAYLPEACKSD